MSIVAAALIEVMDKEAPPRVVWALGLGVGLLGYYGARWHRWTAVLSVAVLGVVFTALGTELLDPGVRTDIRTETGGTYGWHVLAAGCVGLALIVAGARRSSRDRLS